MTPATERQIKTSDLVIGMYVSHLDRPWVETPFMFQGFRIEGKEDIEALKKHCRYVYIDPTQGEAPRTEIGGEALLKSASEDEILASASEGRLTHSGLIYNDSATVREEIPHAFKAYNEVKELINVIHSETAKGRSLRVPLIRDAVTPFIESVLRNPDALLQLVMLKGNKPEVNGDVLGAAVLAAVTGRQLGLEKKELQEFVAGTLLYDVGMHKMPTDLLNKPRRFSPAELNIIQDHVAEGVEIVSEAVGVTTRIITMAEHHHERVDGSGYPTGLEGNNIPAFGRLTAIIDCFNAITTPRMYSKALSPYKAAIKLFEWRGVDFDANLVEHFLQAVGIYPIGTIVELTDGSVGVIVAQNKKRRLNPTVLLLLDEIKQPIERPKTVDLSTGAEDKLGNHLSLKRALEPCSYNIDLSNFCFAN